MQRCQTYHFRFQKGCKDSHAMAGIFLCLPSYPNFLCLSNPLQWSARCIPQSLNTSNAFLHQCYCSLQFSACNLICPYNSTPLIIISASRLKPCYFTPLNSYRASFISWLVLYHILSRIIIYTLLVRIFTPTMSIDQDISFLRSTMYLNLHPNHNCSNVVHGLMCLLGGR